MDRVTLENIVNKALTHRCIVTLEVHYQAPPCGECVDGVTTIEGGFTYEFEMQTKPAVGDQVYVAGKVLTLNSVIWHAEDKFWSVSAKSLVITKQHDVQSTLDRMIREGWGSLV